MTPDDWDLSSVVRVRVDENVRQENLRRKRDDFIRK